ncbi:MAG: guanylate kinase [Candidatus Aureabacteria bacterium]|nr:guanylate kinase [Candidatus Auribacterota bacterium]
MKGTLFVVTAPSGAGKTTICDAVLKSVPRLKYSVSATTRPPRRGETHGEDYFFLSREEFERGIKEGRFLEHALVYDNYYGTPRAYIEKELDAGFDIIMDIDVQGALSIKALKYPAVFVYIVPPSLRVLRERLDGRKTDSCEVIEKRLAQAQKEISYLPEYDYAIVNERLPAAIADMESVIKAERCRVSRRPNLVRSILDS